MSFLAPELLYLPSNKMDRSYQRTILRQLAERYDAYVEPCVGGFGTTLEAIESGWKREVVDCSDVGLYPSVLGTIASGGHPRSLNVRIRGEEQDLDDDPVRAGAEVLWMLLFYRTVWRGSAYTDALAADLEGRRDEHLAALTKHLGKLVKRLEGLSYRPLDIFDHVRERMNERCVIVTDPPAYKSGYEKMMDTAGVLTWDEPTYGVFDPADGFRQLRELMEGAEALLVCGQKAAPGQCAHPRPAYARDVHPGLYTYIWSNRPDELLEVGGGLRVVTRQHRVGEPLDVPLLTEDVELTEDTKIQLVKVPVSTAIYYKDLWLHRLAGREAGYYFAVLLDGRLAGVCSVSTNPITRPYRGMALEKREGMLYRWGVGPPHRYRMPRLLNLLCLQRPVYEWLLPDRTQLYLGMSSRVVTILYSKHPEAKSKRGLMKLTGREVHPDGWKLTYESPLGSMTPEEAYLSWLTTERKYAAQKAKVA